MAELAGAEGVLLTSSTRDVQPVAELDGRSLSQTSASRAAVALFARRAAENVDP
jgi:branched-chain amino acid aminotransferase